MTRALRRLLPAILLLLARCAAVPGATDGIIPPVAIQGARMAPAPLRASLHLPPDAGPHAVVILLHGCGGLGPNQQIWVNRLLGWGYGALVLDSFSARGLRTVCAPANQPLLTGADRAGDVVAASQWLQHQPGVDGSRIAVLGESHGGGTAMFVANAHFQSEEAGLVKGVVNYYGPCRNPAGHGTMPVLALAGEDDTWSEPAASCKRFAAIAGATEPVTVKTYPGTVHGFDNPRLIRTRMSEGHPMRYNAEAAADSFREVQAFLNLVIGPAR